MKHSPLPWLVDRYLECQITQPFVSRRRRIKFPPDHNGFQDALFTATAVNHFEAYEAALKLLMRRVNEIKGHWTEDLDTAMQAAEAVLRKEGVQVPMAGSKTMAALGISDLEF